MGLDMYLEASRYVNREERAATDLRIKDERIETIGNPDAENAWQEIGDLKELRFSAGCWRKANAIHAWFVEHVQDGQDDCGTYYVSRKQLGALLRTVNAVLNTCQLVEGKVSTGYTYEDGKRVPITVDGKKVADATMAQELLPAKVGFFFGSTDYDQWYVEDLQLSKTILEKALAAPEELDFYYHSSW